MILLVLPMHRIFGRTWIYFLMVAVLQQTTGLKYTFGIMEPVTLVPLFQTCILSRSFVEVPPPSKNISRFDQKFCALAIPTRSYTALLSLTGIFTQVLTVKLCRF